MKKANELTRFEEKILHVLYGYEMDIECNGVVFGHPEGIDKTVVELRPMAVEPFRVTDDGDTEFAGFGYYASVVADNLEMTDVQMKETIVALIQKKYVKRFSLSKYEENDTYRARVYKSDFDDEDIQGDAVAYRLTQKATNCLTNR